MRHGQHSQRRGRERCRQRFLHARRQLPAERQRIIEGKEQFVARLVEHALDNATYALLASPALDDQPAVLDGLALARALRERPGAPPVLLIPSGSPQIDSPH